MESHSQVQKSFQIPADEAAPDFEDKPRPITTQEGEITRKCINLTGPTYGAIYSMFILYTFVFSPF